MDAFIHFAKLIGIVLTTILGVLGILTTYRDERKRVTKWGRRTLVAIIVSGALTILVQALESARDAKAQAKELARLSEEIRRQEATLRGVEDVLVQLDRQAFSLGGCSVSLTFEIPERSPILDGFHERFRDVYGRLMSAFATDRHPYDPLHPDFSIVPTPDGKSVDRINLGAAAPEGLPPMSLSLSVGFFPAHADLSSFRFDSSGAQPELVWALYSGRGVKSLSYLPFKQSYLFRFTETPTFADATGSLLSLRDLRGKQVAFGVIDYVPDNGDTLQGMSIDEFSIILPLGVKLSMTGKRIVKGKGEWPVVSFSGTFDSQ